MSTCIQLQPRADFIEKCDLSLNSPRLAHDSSAPPQGKVTWRLQVQRSQQSRGPRCYCTQAAKPHIGESISRDCPHHRSHPFLWALPRVDLNFHVASETTQVPVIFGIPVTKRRVSPNEKSTPQGQDRQYRGRAAVLEAILCHTLQQP